MSRFFQTKVKEMLKKNPVAYQTKKKFLPVLHPIDLIDVQSVVVAKNLN